MVSFKSDLTVASFLSLGVFANAVLGQNITNDSHFYGQVPPVYPTRTFWQKIFQEPSLMAVISPDARFFEMASSA